VTELLTQLTEQGDRLPDTTQQLRLAAQIMAAAADVVVLATELLREGTDQNPGTGGALMAKATSVKSELTQDAVDHQAPTSAGAEMAGAGMTAS
jgi:hypothetical protein